MIGRIVAYLQRRLAARLFVPVVGALTGLAHWTTSLPLQIGVVGRAAAVTTGIVVLLRVWDDIEDRDIDRLAHPDRVLPQGSVGIFIALQLVIASGLAGVLVWSGSTAAAMALLALLMAACLGYRMVRPGVNATAWPYFLLLKYPAIVATVAQTFGTPRQGRLLVALLVTYVGACAYEDLHCRLRRSDSRGATA